jgi:hypothetical protein
VRRVGHQHAIAAGEAQIGGERRALVAALFLDDLDQQHLAALDDVLDLVAAAQVLALAAKLVRGILVLPAGGGGLGRDRLVALLRVARGAAGVVADFLYLLAVGGGGGVLLLILLLILVRGVLGGAQALLLGGMLRFLAQQRLAVLARDLVIIGWISLKARKPWRLPP